MLYGNVIRGQILSIDEIELIKYLLWLGTDFSKLEKENEESLIMLKEGSEKLLSKIK